MDFKIDNFTTAHLPFGPYHDSYYTQMGVDHIREGQRRAKELQTSVEQQASPLLIQLMVDFRNFAGMDNDGSIRITEPRLRSQAQQRLHEGIMEMLNNAH
jgi:hypothetical protein